ncbi:hypothetical protein E3P86_01782 [Wallemia ichthyophaga]|uniref:Major facilitator superfamily (MFS) profile domain-containing protein n=1 Tax=Wallemia ichthyophaga TaxID=245174 RepID=A0A4T0J6Y6_WALIC|nr:hypothetical protein E3P86_01782 [Wallemia ichthyophaga]
MKSDDESTLHSERHSHNNSLSNLNIRCGGDHTGDYDKATNLEIKGQELQREQRTDDRVSDKGSEINTDKQQQQRQHDASTSNSTPEHTNNGENAVVEKEQRTDGLDDQTNLMPRKQIIVVFMGVSSALFISLLDQTVISTALPDISSEFHAAGKGNWVATSYLLTSTAWQGLIGVIVAISNSLGPILGGVFTETIGWRWIFWINLPLTGAAILIVQIFLPQKRITSNPREQIKRIDYIGTILVLASTTLTLLSLNWGGNEYAWDSAVVIALLVVGVVLMVVFVLVEASSFINLPILPMYLFNDRSVSASFFCTFFSGTIFYGALYFLPHYLQVVKEYSPLRSGVVLLGLILTQTLFSFTSGVIVSKTGGYRVNIWTGFLMWTIGLGLFTMLSPSTSIAEFVGFSVISGFGAGNTFQTTLLSVQAAVKRQEIAVATGGRNFIRLLGGTIGLALCDVILRNTLITGLHSLGSSESEINEITQDPTAIRTVEGIDTGKVLGIYCDGIRNIFILFTAASGASFACSLLIRQYALDKPDDQILKEEGKEWNEEHHLAVLLTVAAKPSFNVPPLLFILEYTLVNAPTRARNAQSLSLTRPHLHVIEEFTLERGPISVLFKAVASPFLHLEDRSPSPQVDQDEKVDKFDHPQQPALTIPHTLSNIHNVQPTECVPITQPSLYSLSMDHKPQPYMHTPIPQLSSYQDDSPSNSTVFSSPATPSYSQSQPDFLYTQPPPPHAFNFYESASPFVYLNTQLQAQAKHTQPTHTHAHYTINHHSQLLTPPQSADPNQFGPFAYGPPPMSPVGVEDEFGTYPFVPPSPPLTGYSSTHFDENAYQDPYPSQPHVLTGLGLDLVQDTE